MTDLPLEWPIGGVSDEVLRKMFPRPPRNDHRNEVARHAVFTSQGILGRRAARVALPNSDYLFRADCGAAVEFSAQLGLPSFAVPVAHVVCVRPEPEMLGINASSIITTMQDMKPIRDRASEQQKGNSVRRDHSAMDLDGPVSSTKSDSRPFPAPCRMRIDFREEAIYDALACKHAGHLRASARGCPVRRGAA